MVKAGVCSSTGVCRLADEVMEEAKSASTKGQTGNWYREKVLDYRLDRVTNKERDRFGKDDLRPSK
jgi:hypothetical protein